MKMKQYILVYLFLLGALLSCSKEEPKNTKETKMAYPISFCLKNFAHTAKTRGMDIELRTGSSSSSSSYDFERAIDNLTIFVFTSNETEEAPMALEKIITNDEIVYSNRSNPYEGDLKFDVGMPGSFHLEVVANAYAQGDDVAKRAFLQKFEERPLLYREFKKVIINKSLPEYGSTGFMMLSAEPIKVKIEKQSDTYPRYTEVTTPVTLRRLVARFDVINRIPSLFLDKITLKGQQTKSFLFTNSTSLTDASQDKIYNTDPRWFSTERATGGIYSYENLQKGVLSLEIEGRYRTGQFKKTIALKSNGIDLPVKRNHLYRIILTERAGDIPVDGDDPKAINYTIEVLDWEETPEFEYSDSEVWGIENKKLVEYKFEIPNNVFMLNGGNGVVKGTKTIYKGMTKESEVLGTEALEGDEFTIAPKDKSDADFSVDDSSKSFSVRANNTPKSYTLVATPLASSAKSVELVVKRTLNPLLFVAEKDFDQKKNLFFDVEEYYGKSDNLKHYTDLYEKEVVAKISNPTTIEGVEYYLPSRQDWESIFPANQRTALLSFKSSYTQLNVKETVKVGGQSHTFYSDIKSKGEDKVYAIRYKGTDMCSVWKYEIILREKGDNYSDNKYDLIVTSRCVDLSKGITLDAIMKEEFWQNDKERDVTRRFLYQMNPSDEEFGSYIYNANNFYIPYWTTTSNPHGSYEILLLSLSQIYYTDLHNSDYTTTSHQSGKLEDKAMLRLFYKNVPQK